MLKTGRIFWNHALTPRECLQGPSKGLKIRLHSGCNPALPPYTRIGSTLQTTNVPGILGGTETSAPETWRFSIAVAKAWEAEFDAAPLPCLRKVKLRSAMVMSPDREGVFDVLLSLVRKGLGGRAGNGRQYVSWIHYLDFVGAIDWLVAHQELDGAINLCSPNPLPNADFMREIRKASGTKIGLPASKWMLEIGAVFMRTETELILKSRRVIPTRLQQSGYHFDFPVWADAVLDLCQRRNRIIRGAHFLL